MNGLRSAVLGASDPEMESIRGLLRGVGLPFQYALFNREQRVGRRTAYEAVSPPDDPHTLWVECSPKGGRDLILGEGRLADHHNPGDPGYACGPDQFLSGSSLGQVCSLINGGSWSWDETKKIWSLPGISLSANDLNLLVAAADHCPGPAYRNECPGVDAEALADFRLRSRAASQRCSTSYLKGLINAALSKIRQANRRGRPVALGGSTIPDLRGDGVIRELPEAILRYGGPVIARGPRKGQVILHNAPPEVVRAFLRGEGPAAVLEDRYGNPHRGFAGGYVRGCGRRVA